MANEKLREAYDKVFDAQGNVRACGRKACMELIGECEKQDAFTHFGDIATGRMNIEAIKNLIQKN